MASVKRVSTGFESPSSTWRSQEQLCRIAQQPRRIRREPTELTDNYWPTVASSGRETRWNAGFYHEFYGLWNRCSERGIIRLNGGSDCQELLLPSLEKMPLGKFLRNRFYRNWQCYIDGLLRGIEILPPSLNVLEKSGVLQLHCNY